MQELGQKKKSKSTEVWYGSCVYGVHYGTKESAAEPYFCISLLIFQTYQYSTPQKIWSKSFKKCTYNIQYIENKVLLLYVDLIFYVLG